jgi:hypothetical protein
MRNEEPARHPRHTEPHRKITAERTPDFLRLCRVPVELLNGALKDIPNIIVTFAKRTASAKRGTLTTAHAGHHAKMVINNLWRISELRVNRLRPS